MLDGHVFGHISLAHHLTFFLISWTSRAPASSDVPCTIADTMSQYVSCEVAALTGQPSGAVRRCPMSQPADAGTAHPSSASATVFSRG
jgi:hypothetical protein